MASSEETEITLTSPDILEMEESTMLKAAQLAARCLASDGPSGSPFSLHPHSSPSSCPSLCPLSLSVPLLPALRPLTDRALCYFCPFVVPKALSPGRVWAANCTLLPTQHTLLMGLKQTWIGVSTLLNMLFPSLSASSLN